MYPLYWPGVQPLEYFVTVRGQRPDDWDMPWRGGRGAVHFQLPWSENGKPSDEKTWPRRAGRVRTRHPVGATRPPPVTGKRKKASPGRKESPRRLEKAARLARPWSASGTVRYGA